MRGLREGSVARRVAQYLCVAAGSKWWEARALPDSVDETYKTYRFMIRFSEYCFSTDFLSVPEERREREISVADDARIYWRPFVYERRKDGRREMTIHMVQLPQSDFVLRAHDPMTPVKNVAVRVTAPPGETLEEAYALLPNPVPHAVKLSPEADGRIVLPVLEDAAVILCRFQALP